LAVFFWLFETQTAWELLKTDLPGLLRDYGFDVGEPSLYAGGSLQVIQGRKMV
jgi:demethylmenaquinone methyltransferase/2-methoxy-6-polyprenyl-1,4-benzoquinol methylase